MTDVTTTGLTPTDLLTPAELRGVLGHELAHVSGRDILASSVSAGLARIITFPVGVGRLVPGRGAAGRPRAVEAPLMLVFGPIAAMVVRLAVTQSREYRADAAGALGPDLSHLMLRQTIASGMLPNDAATLSRWVSDPQSLKPGCLMPAPALSGNDLAHVTAYLRSLT